MIQFKPNLAEAGILNWLNESGNHCECAILLPDGRSTHLGELFRERFPFDIRAQILMNKYAEGVDASALSAWCTGQGWSCEITKNHLVFNRMA